MDLKSLDLKSINFKSKSKSKSKFPNTTLSNMEGGLLLIIPPLINILGLSYVYDLAFTKSSVRQNTFFFFFNEKLVTLLKRK